MFAARPLAEGGMAEHVRSATPTATARYGALTAACGLAGGEAEPDAFGAAVCWLPPRASHSPTPAAARTATAAETVIGLLRRGPRLAAPRAAAARDAAAPSRPTPGLAAGDLTAPSAPSAPRPCRPMGV